MAATPITRRVRRYRRSPHLLVQWHDDELVLLHCDSLRRFRVDERLLALLAALRDWTSPAELADVRPEVTAADLERLAELGVVVAEDPDAAPGGPRDYWDPLELAVHRQGNHGGYEEARVRDRGEPPPAAFKPIPAGTPTPLPPARPLPATLEGVLARRRSVRTYAARALRLAELSTVLHHAARVSATFADPLLGEHALRPFAAGGARGELELYVVANHVAGLPAGAHYYDARGHTLVQLRRADAYQARLNRALHAATGGRLNRDPAAVLVITAVAARVLWKYQGIGLATIYKNTGCLLQTLYLTATAAGLAPCAVGGGEEWRTARWLGLDPVAEPQVGCFLLGPRRDEQGPAEPGDG